MRHAVFTFLMTLTQHTTTIIATHTPTIIPKMIQINTSQSLVTDINRASSSSTVVQSILANVAS